MKPIRACPICETLEVSLLQTMKFADLGACDGDTIKSFLRRGLLLEKIWNFKSDPQKNILNHLQNLKCKIPITLFPLGVGSQPGQ